MIINIFSSGPVFWILRQNCGTTVKSAKMQLLGFTTACGLVKGVKHSLSVACKVSL